MDFIKRFEALKNRYRVCCEFEEIEGDFKPIPDTACIYCLGHKIKIYPINETFLRCHMMTLPTKIEDKLKELNVFYVKQLEKDSETENVVWGYNGEYVLDIPFEDLDKIKDLFKLKTVSQSKNPYSKANINEFLRFMRNIHPRYGEMLEQRIASNRVQK